MKPATTKVALLVFILIGHPRAFSQTASGVVNSYYAISAVNTATNSVTVDNSAGLEPGELVLIHQTKGATIDATNTATFGNITAINDAGNYEFNTVCSITGNEVWLTAKFVNAYDPAGQLQMAAVPAYQSVTISGTITGSPWDPVAGKGGIVALAATDTIFLNADIDVSGQGFIGGALFNYVSPAPYNCGPFDNVNQYFLPLPASGNIEGGKKGEGVAFYITGEEYARGKLANGGGGGNNANSGGAGGGHYGAGGNGGKRSGESAFSCHGQFPGIGGLSLALFGYSTATNRIFLGGGGGSGHENNGVGEPGGNGGGIIILSAPVIIGGGGRLLANGLAPLNPACTSDPTQAQGDGGGGGGAGGAVILNVPVISGTVEADANGAAGSNASNGVPDCTGPGGGGGGGIVWAFGASFPAAVSVSVNGGISGVISAGSTKTPSCVGQQNGAMAGNPGISQAGYTAPLPTGTACVVLASPILKDFHGVLTAQGSLLNWMLNASNPSADLVSFTVERSDDQVHFNPIATLNVSTDTTNYQYTDPTPFTGTAFYRLIWTDQQGRLSYSNIIALTRPADPFAFVRLHPNPVQNQLSVELFSRSNAAARIRIFNAQGQQLLAYPFTLHLGTTTLTLPVSGLSAGAYFLLAETKDRRQTSSFIKKD